MRSIRSLTRDPMGLLGLTLVVIFLLMAILAPIISPYDPLKISVMSKFQSPNLSHWLGTDHLGRDTLSRIIYGSRTALSIALTATGLGRTLRPSPRPHRRLRPPLARWHSGLAL